MLVELSSSSVLEVEVVVLLVVVLDGFALLAAVLGSLVVLACEGFVVLALLVALVKLVVDTDNPVSLA